MLIIDNREGKLIELIKSKSTDTFKIPYELKSLQIGDIVISSPTHQDKTLIIERKCMTDMIASIKDGRYKEQKLRLLAEAANNPNTKICYLIEGNMQDLRFPNEKTVFYGSIVSSIFRDEIPLIRTGNLHETLDIISRIHDRMLKDITDFFKPNTITRSIIQSNNSSNSISNTVDNIINPDNLDITLQNDVDNTTNNNITTNTYLNSIKKCKKDNLTPQIWNQLSLTNIPGVSTNIAQKITEVYPSIRKLFIEYDKCNNSEERIKLISEIILTDNGKTKRRIGEVVSKRIVEYLYEDESL
jgi:crossover junction endonuclease MUS81